MYTVYIYKLEFYVTNYDIWKVNSYYYSVQNKVSIAIILMLGCFYSVQIKISIAI